MRLLLDTHAYLWIVTQDKRTPNHWVPVVEDTSNDIFLSIASLWEIAIKSSIGKLKIDLTLLELLQNHIEKRGLKLLAIEVSHLIELEKLPHHHRDPFDRLIIAQSIAENLTLVSSDPDFDAYSIQKLY